MQKNIINQEKILILLATHNGEEYLLQQLESISAQSISEWDLYIRDDSSTDQSLEILNKWISSEKNNNIFIEKSSGSHTEGALMNFSKLAEWAIKSDARFYCFCDQDDYWHPDKLKIMREQLRSLEIVYGNNTPILLHSDLRVVDEHMNMISPSFMHFQGLPDPKQHSYQRMLIQNNVTGCASMFNRSLLKFATPLPSTIPVHDWWFALCAESTGYVKFLDQQLVDYRQHGKNLFGARAIEDAKNPLHRHFYKVIFSFPRHLERSIRQGVFLFSRIKSLNLKIGDTKLKHLSEFSKMRSYKFVHRIQILNRMLNSRRNIFIFVYLVLISPIYPKRIVTIK